MTRRPPRTGAAERHSLPLGSIIVSRRLVLLRRVLVGLAALVVLALVAVAVVGVSFVRRPFPQVDGEVAIAGLGAKVSVVRDASGVPHLFGDSILDLAKAQGYVHAQDRFFEMDLRRRTASGTLATLVGSPGVDSDKVIRTMGWRKIAEQELPTLKPLTRQVLQAYADGVNAYLKPRSTNQVAVEYAVLSARVPVGAIPEWTPVDSLVWIKAMAWDLRSNYRDELARARMSGRLTRAQILQVYPTAPLQTRPPILSGEEWSVGSAPGLTRRAAATDPDADAKTWAALTQRTAQQGYDAVGAALSAVPELVGRGEGVGSNSWVVTGAHSATGKPILANDPHLKTSQPGIWVQNSLTCRALSADCPLNVSGFSFAGMPGVIIGHNATIAWGLSNLGPDVTDFYLERVREDTYEVDGIAQPLTQRTEVIEVAGGDPVTITARSTRHGPLLSDVIPALADAGAQAPVADTEDPAERFEVSLAWTGLTPSRTADSLLDVNLARNFPEFRTALTSFAAPGQNFVYADTSGNIGYQATGSVPIRRSAIAKAPAGYWPAPGWDTAYDWQGFVPYQDLPWTLNPQDGVIVAANQAVSASSTPYLTADWDPGYRSTRIAELIAKGGALSAADMADLQLDSDNPLARALVPQLLQVPLASDPFTAQAQDLLRGWDFSTPAEEPAPESAAAAYFNAVWNQFVKLTFDDELPTGMRADGGARWRAAAAALLENPKSPWWDNKQTITVVETREEILRLALVEARLELTRKLGKDPDDWRWGALHTMTLQHPVLGGETSLGPLRWFVNSGPYAVSGGPAIVNATSWDAAAGFGVTAAPSMRMVVDLADLNASTWINLSGASGHPSHPHYADQTGDWVAGRQRPWAFTEAAVRAGDSLSELTLVPASATP